MRASSQEDVGGGDNSQSNAAAKGRASSQGQLQLSSGFGSAAGVSAGYGNAKDGSSGVQPGTHGAPSLLTASSSALIELQELRKVRLSSNGIPLHDPAPTLSAHCQPIRTD